MRLFAEHGYGALSLETIARQAHVSLRTIYRQFGGKAQLFSAVIRRMSDEFVAGLPVEVEAMPLPALEKVLEEFGCRFLQRILQPEVVRLRVQILAEALRFPELAAEFYCHGPSRTIARLGEFFALCQRAGELVETYEGRLLAVHFLNILRGRWWPELELGLIGPPKEDEIRAWVKQAVKLFLWGCRKRAGI